MKSILLACTLGAFAAPGMVHASNVASVPSSTAEALQPYLFDAARAGDAQLLSELLARGADIGGRDSQGSTALILAAYHGRLDALDTLLKAGANPNEADARGNTALMGALFKGKAAIAERLLTDPRIDVDARNHAGQTAAMFAALFGRNAQIESLASHGADLALTDARGSTAEALARRQGNAALAERIAEMLAR